MWIDPQDIRLFYFPLCYPFHSQKSKPTSYSIFFFLQLPNRTSGVRNAARHPLRWLQSNWLTWQAGDNNWLALSAWCWHNNEPLTIIIKLASNIQFHFFFFTTTHSVFLASELPFWTSNFIYFVPKLHNAIEAIQATKLNIKSLYVFSKLLKTTLQHKN